VPAADGQHGDLDPGVVLAHRAVLPIVVVELESIYLFLS
jgi:hypothetical protein